MDQVNKSLKIMLKLTQQKKDHLDNILAITRKQCKVLSANEAEQLLAYIEEKQKHIDAIDRLDEQFNGLFQNIKSELGNSDFKLSNPQGYEIYHQLRNIVVEVKHLMEAIYVLEQQNSSKVKEVMDELKIKIRNINRGKTGRKAYKQPAPMVDGIFIDERK